ncbi:metallophosphoesterase family protein [Caldimonas brevitalea]|uniref:metallophosphoesterase family protein n=1 Tax=Caldimonas brevitalea TaxID=413882 RepID=UPI00069BA1C3|nr:DNA repair exonuclease [Caldimonas brevitalea]
MKFIHAADLHVDSPMRGLDFYEGAPVDRLRGATRRALIALVDLALAERVDLVILAGDIFDDDWVDFHTGLFFREQLVRLRRHGVRVFIKKGNHDAASVVTKQLPAVEGVHVFSSRTAETVVLPELGVAVHGRSFPERAMPDDLVPDYPAPVPGMFNLGVLHTSLTGSPEHDPYAPTSVAALCAKGYDYWALGHIHLREVVREAQPRIVFPGNLQGRHARETGPKGCELVRVDDGVVSAEFVALDAVRWHHLAVPLDGLATLDELARAVLTAVRGAVEGVLDRLHAMRLTLQGRSALAELEAAQPGVLDAAVRAAMQEVSEADVWVEKVKLDLRSPIDRRGAADRGDAVGEVVRLTEWLAADPARLSDWVAQQLKELSSQLGAELAADDPARLGAEELQALLSDAEATVLAQLMDAGAGR